MRAVKIREGAGEARDPNRFRNSSGDVDEEKRREETQQKQRRAGMNKTKETEAAHKPQKTAKDPKEQGKHRDRPATGR